MIERRDDREPVARGDVFGGDAAVLGRAAREHDFAAPLLDAVDLHLWRGLRHGDDGSDTEMLGGVGHRLAVIPR